MNAKEELINQLENTSTRILYDNKQNMKVWKDECAFSFCTPEDPAQNEHCKGLFLNLSTLQSFSHS